MKISSCFSELNTIRLNFGNGNKLEIEQLPTSSQEQHSINCKIEDEYPWNSCGCKWPWNHQACQLEHKLPTICVYVISRKVEWNEQLKNIKYNNWITAIPKHRQVDKPTNTADISSKIFNTSKNSLKQGRQCESGNAKR